MAFEYHSYIDSKLKIVLKKDSYKKNEEFPINWHEGCELLLIKSGIVSVTCDGIENIYTPNQIAVINSSQIHDIKSLSEKCIYYFLIIDNSLFESDIDKFFPPITENPIIIDCYNNIINELENKKQNYKEAIIGYIKIMLSLLSREVFNNQEKNTINKRKLHLVKRVSQYIFENFTEEITLETLSQKLSINKYYLSHIFKEITGNTIITHLNYVRCKNAKSMLLTGNYNVAECAFSCGYNNLSYFSKTYKQIFGNSPIDDLNKKEGL